MSNTDIEPNAESFAAFTQHPRKGAIHMLNLLKFKAQAVYQPGAVDSDPCTGAEAYQRYGRVAVKTIGEVGGRVVWAASPELFVIGEGQDWDQLIIVEYPSVEAFMQMMQLPHYQAAMHHRRAGLAATKLIRCQPATT